MAIARVADTPFVAIVLPHGGKRGDLALPALFVGSQSCSNLNEISLLKRWEGSCTIMND